MSDLMASSSGTDAGLGLGEVDEFLHFAATIIQTAFRGHWQRKRYKVMV